MARNKAVSNIYTHAALVVAVLSVGLYFVYPCRYSSSHGQLREFHREDQLAGL